MAALRFYIVVVALAIFHLGVLSAAQNCVPVFTAATEAQNVIAGFHIEVAFLIVEADSQGWSDQQVATALTAAFTTYFQPNGTMVYVQEPQKPNIVLTGTAALVGFHLFFWQADTDRGEYYTSGMPTITCTNQLSYTFAAIGHNDVHGGMGNHSIPDGPYYEIPEFQEYVVTRANLQSPFLMDKMTKAAPAQMRILNSVAWVNSTVPPYSNIPHKKRVAR
jgi:hypothetical protein